MRNTITYSCIIAFLFLIEACTKDFFVKDIKNDHVSIIAPADNLMTPTNNIVFWWDELDGAENYNLQIVKPDFNSVLQLIIDTTITGNKFSQNLNPGKYQWRIKAMNNGGSTDYTVRSLTIDTTSNLSFLTVNPLTPINNYLTGTKSIYFSWNSLNAATYYNVVISNGTGVLKDTTTYATNYTYQFSIGGLYSWKVRAFNGFSVSQFNTVNSFSIDLTAPPASVITAPIYGASVKDTTYFTWNRTSTDTKYDSVFVSGGNDSNFTSYIGLARVYDTKLKINSFSLVHPGPSAGYYWWRIKSIDSVGNASAFSTRYKFKLQ